MMYKTRKIELAELRRLGMARPGFADSGCAVVQINGDEETVVDWFADRFAAEQDVDDGNAESEMIS